MRTIKYHAAGNVLNRDNSGIEIESISNTTVIFFMTEKDEVDEVVEKLDKLEEENSKKKTISADLLICPKCKIIITEEDFEDDKLAEMGATAIESRIRCPKCGYNGMPVEISEEDYAKLTKE